MNRIAKLSCKESWELWHYCRASTEKYGRQWRNETG